MKQNGEIRRRHSRRRSPLHFTSLRRLSAGRSATRKNHDGHVGGHYSSCTPAHTHMSYELPSTVYCLPSVERTFGFVTPRCNSTPESWRVLTTLHRERLRAASSIVVVVGDAKSSASRVGMFKFSRVLLLFYPFDIDTFF